MQDYKFERKGKKTEPTGRSPLRRRKSTLDLVPPKKKKKKKKKHC
jgi:hypothetical protein